MCSMQHIIIHNNREKHNLQKHMYSMILLLFVLKMCIVFSRSLV